MKRFSVSPDAPPELAVSGSDVVDLQTAIGLATQQWAALAAGVDAGVRQALAELTTAVAEAEARITAASERAVAAVRAAERRATAAVPAPSSGR